MITTLIIVCIFRDDNSTYFRFGPSEDLIVISVLINTWGKWIGLQLFIGVLKSCDVLVNDSTKTPKYTPQSVQLTSENESFPIQKWTYIVVSVSNTFIECYLNGRFVSASKVSSNGLYVLEPAAGADIESGPTFRFGAKGSKMDSGFTRPNGCPVVVTGLSRWDSPLSAGDIYNNYMKGNGNNSSIWGSAYHMDINLKKEKSNYTLAVF
jgi:hypothetical protein